MTDGHFLPNTYIDNRNQNIAANPEFGLGNVAREIILQNGYINNGDPPQLRSNIAYNIRVSSTWNTICFHIKCLLF